MEKTETPAVPPNVLDSWIVMPMIECLDMTVQAVDDCLRQTGLARPPRVLLIDNGSSKEVRRTLEVLQVQHRNRLMVWFHHPPLGGPPAGTLSSTWNAGLDFVWATGAEDALVVNNDVRLDEWTYWALAARLRSQDALFVSAVGVDEAGWQDRPDTRPTGEQLSQSGGGPDFSCFVISQDCHRRYRFDPRFTYFGDNDYHRQLKLGGDGERIFSVNVPYLHYGSATINRSPEASEAYREVFEEHRRRYKEKWGGAVGEETRRDA